MKAVLNPAFVVLAAGATTMMVGIGLAHTLTTAVGLFTYVIGAIWWARG